jgi:hypothetical protein
MSTNGFVSLDVWPRSKALFAAIAEHEGRKLAAQFDRMVQIEALRLGIPDPRASKRATPDKPGA